MHYLTAIKLPVFLLIENHGNLTIQGKDKTIQWEGNFMNKENSQLIFRLDDNTNTDETILHVTGDVTFKKGSQAKLDFKGTSVDNIINKRYCINCFRLGN